MRRDVMRSQGMSLFSAEANLPAVTICPQGVGVGGMAQTMLTPGIGDDEDEAGCTLTFRGMLASYDASEYDELQVDSDVRNLFEHIERYMPHQIKLDTRLKPFIPDFLPSVGSVDPFLKMPRPDEPDIVQNQEQLGVSVLDEPCIADQADDR